jgi:hypothetical protein
LSEVAPSVGGGASTGQDRVARTAEAGTEAPAAPFIRRVLQAVRELDPLGLQTQLDRAAAVLGLARCIDEIVIPATHHLSRLPATGERDADHELMATEAIRTWLNHRGSFAPAPREVGPILLACGPRDRHVVSLECLALLLRFQRWPCRVLGARVSTFTLTIAAKAADAAGVVIVSTESRALTHAVVSLQAIDGLGIPVFFAGSAFEPEHGSSRLPGACRPGGHLPGRYLGSSAEGACALLLSTLTPVTQFHRESDAATGGAPPIPIGTV